MLFLVFGNNAVGERSLCAKVQRHDISAADKAETREVVLHEDVLVASGFVISRRCLEFRARTSPGSSLPASMTKPRRTRRELWTQV